jgi:hypothetical protein
MANLKLEVVIVPVSDVDRAKAFYEKAGFRLDIDVAHENFRGYNSLLLVQRRRSSSARESRRPRLARRNWSSPWMTSTLPATN